MMPATQWAPEVEREEESLSESYPTISLPDIQEAILSERSVTEYLSRLNSEAENAVVRIKEAARSEYRLGDLKGLHHLLLKKHLWGAQIRYRHRGTGWVDTLVVSQRGVQVVRMST